MPAKDPALRPTFPLRALREAAGRTQKEMAEALGVDQGWISRLERRDSIDTETIASYAKCLGYSCRIVFVLDSAGRRHGPPTRRNMVITELVPHSTRTGQAHGSRRRP